jgi:hypothetical protein
MQGLDYAPFNGDGRYKRTPMLRLPNTNPMAVTNAQARATIDAFMQAGHTTHSLAGGTLWVVLVWAQTHGVPYSLRAEPGAGYFVERIARSV